MKEQQTKGDISQQLEIVQEVIALEKIINELRTEGKFPFAIRLRGSAFTEAANLLKERDPKLVTIPSGNPYKPDEMALIAPRSIGPEEFARIEDEVKNLGREFSMYP